MAQLFRQHLFPLLERIETSSVDESGWDDSGNGPGSTEGKYINWLTISDQEQSVIGDVRRIRSSSMVPPEITIYGYIYDCQTGKLVEVTAATLAGTPG